MTSAPSTPRWYSLHLGTWIIVVFFLGYFVLANLVGMPGHADNTSEFYGADELLKNLPEAAVEIVHGYPMPYLKRSPFIFGSPFCLSNLSSSSRLPFYSAEVVEIRPFPLAIDVAIGIATLLCIGVVTERRLRSSAPYQFGIRGLLLLTTLVAVMLASDQYFQSNTPCWISAPFCAGLACVAYVIVLGVGTAFRRLSGARQEIP